MPVAIIRRRHFEASGAVSPALARSLGSGIDLGQVLLGQIIGEDLLSVADPSPLRRIAPIAILRPLPGASLDQLLKSAGQADRRNGINPGTLASEPQEERAITAAWT